ncbi:leucine carboxyl methyltransferase [Morchella conica CCBAS932]|uniref:Leucine carboxyl methyltransferase 1 n=1 Tax=Morchella conica CCBAS932 TaxID=1392247 RepID=A0A3N4KNP5_9PEZI|nr:leucine carboxyl methyltransferase [Morchella conica CCBAS932]
MSSTPLRFPGPNRFRSDKEKDQTPEAKDRVVQQTDQDASQSRLSAVETGYLVDPFARAFVEGPVQKKLPLINRGTYVRTTAIDQLVTRFLTSTSSRKQIISLGAGSDTRYLRLLTTHRAAAASLLYHEIDFSAVTSRKIRALTRGAPSSPSSPSSLVSELLLSPPTALTDDALASAHYYIHPLDLRTLHPGCALPAGVERGLPTLFISECCLIYLAPQEADAIVRWITTDFSGDVGVVLYEPIGGEDAFGQVMVQNLAARGIVLKTLKKYSSLERQRERLRVLGLVGGQEAADVDFLYECWVGERERGRIGGLEMLDEMEEWRLLARHYCVVWGWRGGFGGWEGAWPVQGGSRV